MRWLPNLCHMPVKFRALPQRQKVVDLASRQTNQKQIYHFLYTARHFLDCAGVRFSRGLGPQTYSSEAADRGKPAKRSAQAARAGANSATRRLTCVSFQKHFVQHMLARYSGHLRPQSMQITRMMNSLTRVPSWIASNWKTSAVVVCAVGVAATCRWYLETDKARVQRAQRKREKELRALADKI